MGDGGAALDGEEEEEALEGMEEDALDEDGDALEDMKRWWCGRWWGTRCRGAASVLQAGSAPGRVLRSANEQGRYFQRTLDAWNLQLDTWR